MSEARAEAKRSTPHKAASTTRECDHGSVFCDGSFVGSGTVWHTLPTGELGLPWLTETHELGRSLW